MPLKNPTTQAEQRYYRAHIATRNVVERQYGVWKRRFPVMSLGLRCKFENISNIIVATAVLHNIATAAREIEPPEDPEINIQLVQNQDNMQLGLPAIHINNRGRAGYAAILGR